MREEAYMFAENAEMSAMKMMRFMSVPTAGTPAISRTAAKAFVFMASPSQGSSAISKMTEPT